MSTLPFNPYYTKPKQPYTNVGSGNSLSHINSGLQSAAMVADDVSDIARKGPQSQYSYSGGRPIYDNAGAMNQLNDMNAQAKGLGLKTIKSTAKYAAAGSSFGPVGTLVGGFVGAGLGLAKGLSDKDRADKFNDSMVDSTKKYNGDLMRYNSNIAMDGVNQRQQEQYSSKNPYQIPSSSYWF